MGSSILNSMLFWVCHALTTFGIHTKNHESLLIIQPNFSAKINHTSALPRLRVPSPQSHLCSQYIAYQAQIAKTIPQTTFWCPSSCVKLEKKSPIFQECKHLHLSSQTSLKSSGIISPSKNPCSTNTQNLLMLYIHCAQLSIGGHQKQEKRKKQEENRAQVKEAKWTNYSHTFHVLINEPRMGEWNRE